MIDPSVLMERSIVSAILYHAAAGEDDLSGQLSDFSRHFPLQCAEGGFAFGSEDIGDGAAGFFHDTSIQINSLATGHGRQDLSQCGFSAAGHADQHDVGHFLPQHGKDPLVFTVGDLFFEEVLLCGLGLCHQHGQAVAAGDSPLFSLQKQSRAAGIVNDIQNAFTVGECGEIHRADTHGGIHSNRRGVDEDLCVRVAGQIFVVVFTGAGHHDHLAGTHGFTYGLRGQRSAAAAEDDHLFAVYPDARPFRHPAEAGGIGVPGIKPAVRTADQRVDAADGLCGFIDHIAVCHHIPLVGNGDIQTANVGTGEKRPQFLRFQFN